MLLKQSYGPLVDSYERYEKRVIRLCSALSMHDIHTDEAVYRSILWDAEITSQIHSFRDEQQMAWLKQAFAQIISAADDVMGEEEKEWRLDVVNRRLKDQGYNSPARYVDKIAAGSPASYKGTPFKFEMRGGVPPPKVPLMPLNLGRNQKWEGQERVITPHKQKLEQASSSPSIAGSAQEQVQAAILERLDQMEQAAAKIRVKDLWLRL